MTWDRLWAVLGEMTSFEEADASGCEGRVVSIRKPCNTVGSFMARKDLRGCGEDGCRGCKGDGMEPKDVSSIRLLAEVMKEFMLVGEGMSGVETWSEGGAVSGEWWSTEDWGFWG